MKFIALLLLSVQTAAAVTVEELQCEHRRDRWASTWSNRG